MPVTQHIAGPGAHEPESMFVDHDPTSPVENHEAGSPEHDAEHIPDLDVSATSHLAPGSRTAIWTTATRLLRLQPCLLSF